MMISEGLGYDGRHSTRAWRSTFEQASWKWVHTRRLCVPLANHQFQRKINEYGRTTEGVLPKMPVYKLCEFFILE